MPVIEKPIAKAAPPKQNVTERNASDGKTVLPFPANRIAQRVRYEAALVAHPSATDFVIG